LSYEASGEAVIDILYHLGDLYPEQDLQKGAQIM